MSVASKNPFDLLGGENDGDSDVPKSNARTAAKIDAGTTGGARRGVSGNDAAFRDRNIGSATNRGKPTDDSYRGPHRGGSGARVRGGRGSGHPRNRDDRHSKQMPSGSEKQASLSWGAAEGTAELKDEQAGEEMAKTEKKDDVEGEGEPKDAAAAEPAEPEEKHISFAEYQAQQAAKKAALEAEVNLRKPNEGSKLDKKWANAQPLTKNDDDVYFEGTGGKNKRERERKTKQILDIDQRFVEPERGGRGGRGRGGRGGRGGEFRGSRGAPRGGRGRGGGPPSAGPGKTTIDPKDQSAFPSLGA
ncbi:hypothetical protein MKZ38_010322 [Zalerion maritima]|uniref:Hyaluronan/mRNA-binding protein domain-containing protein n=1 Tax=Zalerion maritima TaxID=339359 RepID=A0AAD5RZM2_9PEZI|nr:hypothetical protein MKZ38_010322 [Zalerion maritima]